MLSPLSSPSGPRVLQKNSRQTATTPTSPSISAPGPSAFYSLGCSSQSRGAPATADTLGRAPPPASATSLTLSSADSHTLFSASEDSHRTGMQSISPEESQTLQGLSPIEAFKLRLAEASHLPPLSTSPPAAPPRRPSADASFPPSVTRSRLQRPPLGVRRTLSAASVYNGSGGRHAHTQSVQSAAAESSSAGRTPVLRIIDALLPAPRPRGSPPRPAEDTSRRRPSVRDVVLPRKSRSAPQIQDHDGDAMMWTRPASPGSRGDAFSATPLMRIDSRSSAASSVAFAAPATTQHASSSSPEAPLPELEYEPDDAYGYVRPDSPASSLASTLEFVPTAVLRHQRPADMDPDPLESMENPIYRLQAPAPPAERAQSPLPNKLARTLGLQDAAGRADPMLRPRPPPPESQHSAASRKQARRASISFSGLLAPRPLSPADQPPLSARRKSSFGSIASFLQLSRGATPDLSLGALPDPDPRDIARSPSCPPQRGVPRDIDAADGSWELLAHGAAGVRRRASVYSDASAELHRQPRRLGSRADGSESESAADDDDDRDDSEYILYERAQAETPTPVRPYWSAAETPFKFFDEDGYFISSFPVLFKAEHRPAGDAEDNLWTGEWNQKDMQSVIQSLRKLKF